MRGAPRWTRGKDGTIKIFQQLEDLAAYPLPMLVLEGRPSNLYRRLEPMLAGLQFWCARQGISILYTTSPQASAHAVVIAARKLEAELTAI